MTKIATITQEQLDKLRKAKNQSKVFKEILGLLTDTEYDLGDTVVTIDNAKPFEVYEYIFNGKSVYYLVLEAISDELAFAYSLYPVA